MFINENGADQWRKMLTENFNVTDQQKLNWVSQYAAIHEIYESQFGVNGGNVVTGAAHPGVGPIYATPLNTLGMGNVYAPGQLPVGPDAQGVQAMDPVNFWKQSVGSGDIPQSTLPMALNVALLTIGLELVPVIPAKGPWQMVSYMDFPYAGGKLGRVNETSFDGIGEKNENKPIYVKITGLTLEDVKDIREEMKTGGVKAGVAVTAGVFKGKFIDLGRMDACPLAVVEESGNVSLREAFAAATTLKIGSYEVEVEAGTLKPDFVQTSVDLVDGFANFATGAQAPMTRAENETGTGNTIGLRLFTKWIQVGSYEVTGTVTRQQLQDLPLYGVDATGKIMEAMQNELTQHINQRILERVFRLGVTNAAQQKARQGVDLNLYLGETGASGKNLANFPIKEYKDIYGVDHKASWGTIVNAEALSSAENTATRQRRISSRILAAAVLIQNVGRRGRATWIVTNAKVAAALQDVSGYVVAPMVNNMAQDGSQNLYLGGTIAGLKVYVDPYMDWEDTRICVGRKGDANSPGVIFMPYILADTVTITAEGTMAPKMLVNSRYALTEIGFYPQLQYYTFAVNSEFDII